MLVPVALSAAAYLGLNHHYKSRIVAASQDVASSPSLSTDKLPRLMRTTIEPARYMQYMDMTRGSGNTVVDVIQRHDAYKSQNAQHRLHQDDLSPVVRAVMAV